MLPLPSPPRFSLAPVVGLLAALCFFAGGGAYVRGQRAQAAAAVATPQVAAVAPPPAPVAPTEPLPLASLPPSGLSQDRPAPACVAELLKAHVQRAGPGLAIVACEGKSYQCVVTLVGELVAFNCSEVTLQVAPGTSAAPKGAGGDELSL